VLEHPRIRISCRGLDSVRVLRPAVGDEDHAQHYSTNEEGMSRTVRMVVSMPPMFTATRVSVTDLMSTS
jgi:hypothetical protein